MKQYSIISTNYRNFKLILDDKELAELTYPKWYSFKAEIKLANQSVYTLEPKGFWDAQIELKQGGDVLMNFKLGWKGIMINVLTYNTDDHYLLRHKGILSSQYVLVDTNEQELLAVKPDFHWSKFKLDYTIETSDEFEKMKMKEAFLLTIIHSINYQMAAGAV